MTKYEKRFLFEAIKRVVDATSHNRRMAVMVSSWLEIEVPQFDLAVNLPHKARRVPKKKWHRLRNRIEDLCLKSSKLAPDSTDRAIRSLGHLVGLNATEIAIFRLVFYSHECKVVDRLCEFLVDDVRMDAHSAIALLMNLPRGKVNNALAKKNRLLSCGLISKYFSTDSELGFDISVQLKSLIKDGCNTPAQFRDSLFPQAPNATTKWNDFDHLGELRDLSARVLNPSSAFLTYSKP